MAFKSMKNAVLSLLFTTLILLGTSSSSAFQSDELILDDDEFEGVLPAAHQQRRPSSSSEQPPARATTSPSPTTTRRRQSDAGSDPDSKIQFSLEHAFGDSEFSSAGTFSARFKTWSHGGQTLTKLRFSRNAFTDADKEQFKKLLDRDGFYRIRLPSDVLSPPGREYVISSVKARCLPKGGLDEHFVIHMEGINVVAVNYASTGACPHPRQLRIPSKWSFNSHTILKNSEQAPRTPVFSEDIIGGENGEGEGVPPPERSFWAKYWMYLIPLGFILMNVMTQAMNAAEQEAAGQSGPQMQQPTGAAQRGQSTVVRRR